MKRLTLLVAVLLIAGCQSESPRAESAAVKSDLKVAGRAGVFTLSPLFTDNLVLQRGIPIPVWGWADAGTMVTVSLGDQSAQAVADTDGRWLAKLKPVPAGGPYTLSAASATTVTLGNVLVGDVWICSGQSNMEMGIGPAGNAQLEIANANYPRIRLFTVQKTIALTPQDKLTGHWDVCTPATVAAGGWGGFSAAGYYFGRHLHNELNIPIGLIHTSWGGTVAQAWTSGEVLAAKLPEFSPALAQIAELAAHRDSATYDQKLAAWWATADAGSKNGWSDPAFDAGAWKSMPVPGAWEQSALPDFDGVVWFRKEVDLPADAAGKDAVLHLGAIDDADTTWVNGVVVGEMSNWQAKRDYKIPGKLLKAGRNVIAVRVLDTGGGGGFVGETDQLALDVPGHPLIRLAGPWPYQVSTPFAKLPPLPMKADNNPNMPTVLYNGMIAPLIPYGITGAIWYQGESNAGAAFQYRTLLPAMIGDWRTRWGQGDFPFVIVQLANFMDTAAQPGESAWAELREAQLLTARNVAKTGLAVAIDIGDAKDIHPKNKQEVGRRLALSALAIHYGKQLEWSGPEYQGMTVADGKIRLKFSHLGGGLVAKDGKLQGFAIAGEDHAFVWADAAIDGDSVVVSSSEVAKPVAVRYAWANNPVCNLYNQAGLPASPFRTDDWVRGK